MSKPLYRSDNRWIAGVCGGLAEYFDWDANIVRLIYLIISVCSAAFPGILIYIILWFCMPSKH